MGVVGTPRHRWTEAEFRKAVTESDSIAATIRALGLAMAGGSYRTVCHYISVWELDTSHFVGQAWVGKREGPTPGQRYTLETIFCEKSTYPTHHLLEIILRQGYLPRQCARCLLVEWQGEPIPIEVDHINGVGNDHRRTNLRLLCPNCHALTPSWRGRKNSKTYARAV